MRWIAMDQMPVLNFLDFITAEGDALTTDSLKVATVHGKRHDDVLRLIRKRIADAGEWAGSALPRPVAGAAFGT